VGVNRNTACKYHKQFAPGNYPSVLDLEFVNRRITASAHRIKDLHLQIAMFRELIGAEKATMEAFERVRGKLQEAKRQSVV